ncbi:glycosyltransferase family 2 protein [Geodermatophilus sp. CPCC 205761]|uniref:glycosyltransferase family 2 protein n=1 Tax=Geodermatophilus sp. CPCC 205761 TaxID=2936597 RepID=UPI003EEB7345
MATVEARSSRETGHRDVELVVVAYRSRAQVEQMLAGLPAHVPLVLVDNSDDEDGLSDVIAGFPNGRYLKGGGVGFSRAANLGARTSTAEFLVFVNPDTRPTMEHIRALVEDVATDPGCSASAGVVVGSDGRPLWGMAGREPTLLRATVQSLGLHRLFPRLGIYSDPGIRDDMDVDWVCGACMAVRRQTFLELGCFDETFYVYNEDMTFGRQIRERGLRQRLRTDVAIEGVDGGSGAPAAEMRRLRGSSMSLYLHKYHPRPMAAAITVCLGAGHIARGALYALRGDRSRAVASWAEAMGLFTGRASVAGQVVAGAH